MTRAYYYRFEDDGWYVARTFAVIVATVLVDFKDADLLCRSMADCDVSRSIESVTNNGLSIGAGGSRY